MDTDFFFRSWAEFFFFVLVIIGVIVSLSAPSAVISYIIILLSGMLAGRLIYSRKKKLHFAYYLIISGFLIGYLIGAYYGDRKVIIILFIFGAIFSYYLYDKNIVRDTFI